MPDEGGRGTAISRAPGVHRLGYRPALDGIRALAVLAVIAYHYDYRWAKGGFLGVDAFFVLSGFLITTLLVLEFREHETIRLVAFWGRRARRLLPALFLVLLFVALYTRHDVAPWQRPAFRNDGLASLFYVANWRFIFTKQSYFELFAGASPLRHMWSLAIEEQFYLIWPLVVLLCVRLGRGSLRLLTTVCVAGTLASIAVMAATYTAGDPTRAYFGTDARAHSLLVGALLSIVLLVRAPRPGSRRVVQPLGIIAAAAIVVSWTLVSGSSRGYYHGGSAVYALAVAAVIAATLQGGLLARALAVRPLVWIGRISYGLYLWHWPINVWLTPTRAGAHGDALNLFRLGATFAAAIVSYYVVERPVRMRRFSFPGRPAVAAVAAAAVAFAMATAAAGAGAVQAPRYMWVFGQPTACGGPSRAEHNEAVAAAQHIGTPAKPLARRVVLVGDSLACSLFPGMSVVGQLAGTTVDQGVVTGCGVVSEATVDTNGEKTMVSTEVCHDLVQHSEERALTRSRPDVVVWFSEWERFNMKVGGSVVTAGTPNADALLLSRMDAAFARLTAGGAHLVILTVPSFTDGTALGMQTTTNPTRDAAIGHLNRLLRRFAVAHPGQISVVDLARHVCPTLSPCAPDVDGRRPRPDGAHFSPAGSVWASKWVFEQLAACLKR